MMLRRSPRLTAFEDTQARAHRPDLLAGLAVVEALLREACDLGVWPPCDPLGGIEADIRMARALHVHRAAGQPRHGA